MKNAPEYGIIMETIGKEPRLTMIILITGASHTGKTLLAQKLLEKYKYPYLSIDHLKMGLIRSGQTELTPFDWQDSFDADYLTQIKYICLVMSESYINSHFSDIVSFGNAIEKRLSNELSIEDIIQDNQEYLRGCIRYGLDYYLIDDKFDIEKCFI